MLKPQAQMKNDCRRLHPASIFQHKTPHFYRSSFLSMWKAPQTILVVQTHSWVVPPGTVCEMNPEVEQMKDREKVGQKPRAVQQFCMLHCSGARARQLPLPQWIQAAPHRLPTKQFVRPHLSLNRAETRWAKALRQASEGVLGKSQWISFIYAAVRLNRST